MNGVPAERKRKHERIKCVRVKSPHNLGCGIKAFATDFFLAFQLAFIAAMYAFLAYELSLFFYVSLCLTAVAGIHAFSTVYDSHCRAGWLVFLILSCGSGYIFYFLADKRVCFGADSKKLRALYARPITIVGAYTAPYSSEAVKNDCNYLANTGGFLPYGGRAEYFSSGSGLFKDMLLRLEKAEKFVFIETFIAADGRLLESLLDVLGRKISEGVEVRFLVDDAGCQGKLKASTKKRMRAMGINLKVFSAMFSPFSFSLNFRDHRKIVVIDGKTAYTGGCNIADECVNGVHMSGFWKDSGLRLDGRAVDGMSLIFLKQWDYACKIETEWSDYIGFGESFGGGSVIVPYAGGPNFEESICRGVYVNAVNGAKKRLYIMTPYFIPDGALFDMIKQKALSGTDVRIVLPAIPDWKFIYRVTRDNAERLAAYGVKVYYARGSFIHAKVMLTENCAVVGSANIDMRSFYQQFDNGVYTDDRGVMEDVSADFNDIMDKNTPVEKRVGNIFGRLVCSLLKVVSPLM